MSEVDVTELVAKAQKAGVTLEIADGELSMDAPPSAQHWIRMLESHKAQVMAILRGEAVSQREIADLWPDPLPLPSELSEVMAFNFAMLPRTLRGWVSDIAERIQCPPDYPAITAMVVLASIVGRKIGIRPKRYDDWTVVPNLWGMCIGRPGLMKTPAMQEPLKVLKRLEIEAKAEFDAAAQEHEANAIIDKQRRQVAEKDIRDALKKGGNARAIAMDLLGDNGRAPRRRRYLINDSTVEKLGDQIRQVIDDSGQSHYAIAHGAEIDPGAFSKFYNGSRGLSLKALDRLGGYFDLQIVVGKHGEEH